MRLIIAEKPSMARAIADALGVTGRGDGYIEGRGLVIASCRGHLVQLVEPESYNPSWKYWSLAHLPIVPDHFGLQLADGAGKQFALLKRLMARPDVIDVVNACDSGREGELIFDLVYRHAGCKKPTLRLWTASLTEDAISKAYGQLKPGRAYEGLRDAARCRHEADWLIGMNATRAVTLVAQRAGGQGAWSVGRVQTPTLALLVERDRQIRAFVAKDYWTIVARLRAGAGVLDATWFRLEGDQVVDRLDQQSAARAIATAAAAGPARVDELETEDVSVPPERLYDLTTLQRECNRRWGFTATKTLELAQALYEEHRVLSYPRTNSRHLTDDVAATLPQLLEQLRLQPAYAPIVIALRVAPLGKRFVDNSKVEDHHALLPTGRKPGSLNEDEQRVYDLVTRRLLGAHAPDRLERRVKVTCAVGAEHFRASGTTLLAAGWSEIDPLAIARDDATPSDTPAASLPPLRAGDALGIEDVTPKAGRTKPPRPYTEADLLGAMETAGKALEDEEARLAMKDSGLGTPATRASIIETLIARAYVERRKRQLVPTPKGITLIDSLAVEALRSPALTGDWEARLARMARGAYARATFMREIGDFTRQAIATIVATPIAAPAAPPPAPAGASKPHPSRSSRNGQRAAPARLSTSRSPAPAAAAGERPPTPEPAACDGCGSLARVIWVEKQRAWFFRCDPCKVWGQASA